MLERVKRPDAREIEFKYDALGRRIEKRNENTITRWVWDGNVMLHEQTESHWRAWDNELKKEYVEGCKNPLITWVFEEGTFVPAAKLTGKKKLSIVSNYMGTPEAMFREDGEKVWSCELNSYGKVRNYQGETKTDCPFRFVGMYEDGETGLCYNRMRYYDPNMGCYLSQDPIGLMGGLTLYSYVHDPNSWIDPSGLSGFFTPSTFNAPSGNVHTVYQQKIDWDLSSIGKGGKVETNLDRAVRGDAPCK